MTVMRYSLSGFRNLASQLEQPEKLEQLTTTYYHIEQLNFNLHLEQS